MNDDRFLIRTIRQPAPAYPEVQKETSCNTSTPKPRYKKSPASSFEEAGHITGDDLLSRDLTSNYHRRNSVSRPGSEWDRVVPLCSGHQNATPSSFDGTEVLVTPA